MSYYFSKALEIPFDDAVQKVTEELQKQGFGILTEIDVKETMKKKLDVKLRPYKILGACNPNFAFQALQVENNIGAMLPCNVVVRDTGSKVEVSAIDPIASMASVENPKLEGIATQVQTLLKNVIEGL